MTSAATIKRAAVMIRRGVPDAEISQTLNLSKRIVSQWRLLMGMRRKSIGEERISNFLTLYESGLNDSDIARQWGVSREYVRQIRSKCNLPVSKAKYITREKLYLEGKNDVEIAEITGDDVKTIKQWRGASHRVLTKNLILRENIETKLVELNVAGYNDGQIARQLGTYPQQIRRYRLKFGIKSQAKSRNPKYR